MLMKRGGEKDRKRSVGIGYEEGIRVSEEDVGDRIT